MKPKNIVAFFVALGLVSCLSAPAPVPTETAKPTYTSLPPSAGIAPKPTLTKTATATPADTPIPTKTFAPLPSERPEGDRISGTYKFDRADGGFCALRVVLQPFLMSYEEIVAELFCLRGPPSYNSGYAGPQKILMSKNIAVYSVPEEYYFGSGGGLMADAPCHLVFQFNQNTVTVTQLGQPFDCGFGGAVYANGVYKLVDPTPPVLGCLSIWTPCSEQYPVP